MSILFRLFLIAALATLTLLAAGCGGGNDSTDEDAALVTVTGRRHRELNLALSTPRAVYARGEEITYTLTVTNTGTEPITLSYTSPREAVEQVRRSDTEEVVYYLPGEGGLYDPHDTTYAPGQSRAIEFTWDQKSSKIPSVQVSPGEYTLGVALWSGGYDGEAELPAAPLTIRISE